MLWSQAFSGQRLKIDKIWRLICNVSSIWREIKKLYYILDSFHFQVLFIECVFLVFFILKILEFIYCKFFMKFSASITTLNCCADIIIFKKNAHFFYQPSHMLFITEDNITQNMPTIFKYFSRTIFLKIHDSIEQIQNVR